MHSRIQRTAYHEAGHAVVRHWLRLRFVYVTIDPDFATQSDEVFLKTLGQVRPWRTGRRPDFNHGGNERRIDREVMTVFAGVEAEHIVTGRRPNTVAGDTDRKTLINLATERNYDGDIKAAELYLKWLQYRTRKLLESPMVWCAVKALARALLDKKTIRYKEAETVIQKAYRDLFEAQKRR